MTGVGVCLEGPALSHGHIKGTSRALFQVQGGRWMAVGEMSWGERVEGSVHLILDGWFQTGRLSLVKFTLLMGILHLILLLIWNMAYLCVGTQSAFQHVCNILFISL